PRLRALRTEPAGAEQAPHVIRVVDDIEMVMDQVDDASTRPQARAIAGRFRPGDDQARQSTALCRAELRRSSGGRPGAQGGAALTAGRPLPSAGGGAGGPRADRPPGARPRHERGCHAGASRSRGVAAARVQPGSPVGACGTSHRRAYPTRTLLRQLSLVRLYFVVVTTFCD